LDSYIQVIPTNPIYELSKEYHGCGPSVNQPFTPQS